MAPALAVSAARTPTEAGRRLMVVGPGGVEHTTIDALPDTLRAGDLVVVNDADTVAASLGATTDAGERVELRLAAHLDADRFLVAALGAGSWRTPTEHRGPPPVLRAGQRLSLDGGDVARVEEVRDARLCVVRLPERWVRATHRHGEPVRYSYLAKAAPLRAFRTRFASRPWAMESPSAGLPLRWEHLLALRTRGVALATVTHATGLSSIDGGALDAALPLSERTDVPPATVDAVARARARGGRVVAIGTTVVRAMEGRAADAGVLIPGETVTSWLAGPHTPLRVVDAVLTKVHLPGESHFELVRAFVDDHRQLAALGEAAALGYRHHEFGDSVLWWGAHPG